MVDLNLNASPNESALWRAIRSAGSTTVAVMGMSKNTGKTVALNHLLAQAASAGVTVGVSSIGRDGEDHDQVFFFPKPPVLVWPGNLVATARATLARAKVRFQQLRATGIASAMGEIVIALVQEHGEMEIAGASRGSEQRKVISLLRQCGARLVLLDGALGRSQHASPAIADSVVLATGAAIGGGIGDVLRKTQERLALLGIGQAGEDLRELCQPLFASGGVGIWQRDGAALLHAQIASLNAGAVLLQHIDQQPATIALGGAVGRSAWQALCAIAARQPGLTVVVADGTRLFVDQTDLQALHKVGGRLVAMQCIRISGITLNPYSPMGGSFDAQEFLTAARLALAGYAVSDVVWEEEMKNEGMAG